MFPGQGLNLSLLHWQVDSLPLILYQGSPSTMALDPLWHLAVCYHPS